MSSASSSMWLGRYSSVLMILLCPAIYWALRSPYVLIQYVISEALICARETKCLSIRLSAVVSCINARVACFSLLSCRTGKNMCALALARQQGTYPVHVTYQRTCLRGVQRQDSVPASCGGLYRYGGFVQVYIFGL